MLTSLLAYLRKCGRRTRSLLAGIRLQSLSWPFGVYLIKSILNPNLKNIISGGGLSYWVVIRICSHGIVQAMGCAVFSAMARAVAGCNGWPQGRLRDERFFVGLLWRVWWWCALLFMGSRNWAAVALCLACAQWGSGSDRLICAQLVLGHLTSEGDDYGFWLWIWCWLLKVLLGWHCPVFTIHPVRCISYELVKLGLFHMCFIYFCYMGFDISIGGLGI